MRSSSLRGTVWALTALVALACSSGERRGSPIDAGGDPSDAMTAVDAGADSPVAIDGGVDAPVDPCSGEIRPDVVPCYSGPPATDGVGECTAGTFACSDPARVCAGEVVPSEEACGSMRDEDCDGMIDEGCPTDVPATRRLSVSHHDAIVERGTEWVGWGNNAQGQLGVPGTQLSPVPLPALSGAVQAATGFFHTCMVTASGGVSCLGRNMYGALGPSSSGGPVAGVTEVERVATGTDATCALHTDGRLTCWGYDWGLGLTGSSVEAFDPTPRSFGTNVADVVLGPHTRCAIDRSAVATCAGTVAPATPIADVASIAPGYTHGCVAKLDGTVACWGERALVGVAISESYATAPVEVPGLAGVADVVASYYHTCARTRAGEVWCWGTGGGSTSPAPSRIESLPPSTEVATRFLLTCSLGADESLWCWGGSPAGDGTTATPSAPVRILP